MSNIALCSVCGLGYVKHLPTLEELAAIYAADYWNGRKAYTDYLADKVGTQLHFQHRIKSLREFSSGGRLFEAGCAYGFFLELAQKVWTVKGVDLSEAAIAYARDTLHLPVEQGDFESNPPEPDTYDVVAMWDTIEHLYDPALAIAKSAEGLRQGGYLALTTADLETLLPRIQKSAWRMFIPAHLHYFSRRSITYLLEAHGLKVVHFSHVSYYRSLRQMAQIITWNKPDSAWRQRLQSAVERLPFMNTYIPLNLYDLMFVIAQKQ
ncbi:MAG: class I SAM-dependent methyltransferase [Chloroflexi bacterium]|nr:class I SAM-dependent methyltransferase [Chloroflexota bacterium]MCC6895638.1 class I SAM-dependent methyltransferase [Anaerolineae bacterium]